MSDEIEPVFGRWGAVMPPDGGRSFWQPLPAGGHVEVIFDPANSPYDGFSCGLQVLPPGHSVREHGHQRNHELLHVLAGSGRCVIEDDEHVVVPGATILFGRNARHYLENTGGEDMRLFWVFMPPGLEDWFEAIGLPRTAGSPSPPPFPRPKDVASTHARMRFVSPKDRQ